MASQIILVDSLISQVRSLLDEDNRSSVSDTADILPALNRAQNYAADLLSRHYESPMLKVTNITTVSGQQDYAIPEDAFEQKLIKVEVQIGSEGVFYDVTRLDFRDISVYENSNSTSIPYYYTIIGDNFRIIPASNAQYPLRIWYLEDPMELVQKQGRINIVNNTDNYVVVDSVGGDITTEADQLESYVNVIDGQTGIRKASFQVKNINGNRINFKTSPARTNVLNTDIDTDMSSLLENVDTTGPTLTINPDDYISLLKGTCVPFFKKPFTNFLIQYAIAEIRRKLGGPAELELNVLRGLEEQVERSWVGREQSLRVKKVSENWDLPVRRYYGINGRSN